jgi:hypothetical protein
MSPTSETTYYLVPNLRALDLSAPEVDLNTHAWVQATVINDTDLTFKGNSLSWWFEKERRRHSSGSDSGSYSGNDSQGPYEQNQAEERRGRRRTRTHYLSYYDF